jgi:hypothetical protein
MKNYLKKITIEPFHRSFCQKHFHNSQLNYVQKPIFSLRFDADFRHYDVYDQVCSCRRGR